MPSPIAHAAASYAIYRIWQEKEAAQPVRTPVRNLTALLVIGFMTVLPDLDFVPGIFVGEFGRFHNRGMNSLLVGVVAAAAVAGIVWLIERARFRMWFFLGLACYQIHLIMDYFTRGRGLMLFWPATSARYEPSINLFHGLHRSDGLLTILHVWTLMNEAAFVLALLIGLRLLLTAPAARRSRARRLLSQPAGAASKNGLPANHPVQEHKRRA